MRFDLMRFDAMTRPTRSPRRKLLLVATGALALVLLGVVAATVVLLSGALSTAATKQHFALTHWILDQGLRYSVRTYSQDVAVPPLTDPAMLRRGLSCYRTYCVQCHGAPGNSPSTEGKGLLPIPNNLAQSARDWPAAWLYYVTKEGVRMTGMPAWGYRLSEDSLWSTVAFLKTLPFLTEQDYRAREARAVMEPCPTSTTLPDLPPRERGEALLHQYACLSCHQIEGVVGPKTFVGPPLVDWSRRKYIAGVIPNTPANLIHFIRDPKAVSPGTLMPDLGVAKAHASEIANFLFAVE